MVSQRTNVQPNGLFLFISMLVISTVFGQSVYAGGPLPQPLLDGNLSDFKDLAMMISQQNLNACGVNQLDNIANGLPPDANGFQDEPLQDDATPQSRYMHSPINVGNFIVIYSPDSDGVVVPASADDSWLGVGINITNGDGDVAGGGLKLETPPDLPANKMVPFDADGNGNPCVLGTGAGSRWFPNEPVIGLNEANEAIALDFFLCANDPADLSGPDFSVVYQQRIMLNTELLVSNLNPATVSAFPAVGSTCASITSRGTDNNTSFSDGLGNDDVEIIINKIDSQVLALFPGEDYFNRTRGRLSRLGVTLRSDASADLSNEDSLFTLCGYDLPELDCSGDGSPDVCESLPCTVPAISSVGVIAIAVGLLLAGAIIGRRQIKLRASQACDAS